jgi:acylphosphatase
MPFMDTVARKVWFSGSVQGVGFRYTALRSANRNHLKGYVRNLDDGRVEMYAIGTPEQIEQCITDLGETFGSYIRDVKVTEESVVSSYMGFEIA